MPRSNVSHHGDFAIDLIVRKGEHNLIRYIFHRFKDRHDGERKELP